MSKCAVRVVTDADLRGVIVVLTQSYSIRPTASLA